jgi:TonB-linked SusC/RagA family outer membrane protein
MSYVSRLLPGWTTLVIVWLACLPATVLAQTASTVTGTVVDAKNNTPVSGASVKVKGTVTGVSTDDKGQFILSVPAGAVLEITNVGYQSQEIKPAGTAPLLVKLEATGEQLGDVVVVGYGTAKKATLTGSVTTISAKTFQDRGPVANPLAALQGQAPGVVVTRSSGAPGRENWQFQIRGASSTNNVDPLVIVDGLPYVSLNALNSINPNDIDNISILKDGAAAIYGARAAGGVVLITTKRAKSGKITVEYNGSVSQKRVGLQPNIMNIDQWANMMKQGQEADKNTSNNIWYNMALAAINRPDSNWYSRADYPYKSDFTDVRDFPFFDGTMQDYLWGNATSTEHQLSISGRNDRSGYRISLGYLRDGSLLQWGQNTNSRYNVRFNNDYQLTPKLKLETNISLEKNDIVQPTRLNDVLGNFIQPGMPSAAKNGKPYVWGSGQGNAAVNWAAELGGEAKEYNTRINSVVNLTYQAMKDLKFVGSAGYYYGITNTATLENMVTYYDYTGTIALGNFPARSSYTEQQIRDAYFSLNGYAEYTKTIRDDHNFKLMAGAQYERDEFKNFNGKTFDILSGVPPSLNLGVGDLTSKTVGQSQNHYALAGYFGRLNYDYDGKYLFEANTRYDGSSRFVADSRWKFFYGFQAGWVLTRENFLQNTGWLSNLKLRASWGSLGSQTGIGLYDYIQMMGLAFSTGPGSSGQPILGTSPIVRVFPSGLVALDRTWERIETSNIGVDFGVLNNRLAGTFEYFLKYNNNMLIARAYPAVLGAGAPAGNNGKLKTWGWEASLNWRDRIGDLTYFIGGNISDNRNKLVNFGGVNIISNANGGFNSAVEGYPINAYYGMVYAGRIQSDKDIEDYKKLFFANGTNINGGFSATSTDPRTSLQLGDNMFRDVNGDGKLTFPEDAVFIGRDDPRFSFSFNGGLAWKGFDLNFIFQGVGERTIARTNNWRMPLATVFQGQNAAFNEKWWTPTRTNASLPRLSATGTINNYNYMPSDWFVENGAYLRLKNLVIGYTLPQQWLQKVKIQKLRIYFSGNDLWETSSIRDGWDPETTRSVNTTERFPFYRYLTAGVNLVF